MADTVEKVKQIKNINRDYLVSIDVKNSTVNKENLVFYITDKKTSNIYVQLVINMSTNNYISKFVVLEEASNYQTQLNIVKPNNEPKTVMGQLLDEENAIFLFDLKDDCKDLIGKYKCEVYASCTVNDRTEGSTSDPFEYTVKSSIFNDLDDPIESDKDYPIILNLIEQIKGLTGTDVTKFTTKEELTNALKEKAAVNHTHQAIDIVEDDAHKFVTQTEKDLWNDAANNKPDLTKYATTESVNTALTNKADKEHTHPQYLTEHQDISNKVDKIDGKGLSTVDFTTDYETKLKSLSNYNDTEIKASINNNKTAINTINDSLANYVTKEAGNANQITFSDGQTFQDKLDAGTLKGAKGDPGPQGDPGANGNDYVLTDSDKQEIANLAGANVDLSGYVTTESLNTSLNKKADKGSLINYVTKTALSNYNYVTTTTFNTALGNVESLLSDI